MEGQAASDSSTLVMNLDGTLFDSAAYAAALREVARRFDISKQVWNTAAKGSEADDLFSLAKVSERVATKTEQPAEPIRRALEAETADGMWYLHADARPFLERVAPLSKLYLLSRGEHDVQRRKLQGAGLERYFHGVFIVTESKAEAQVAPLSSVSQAVFVNDDLNEMLELARRYRWARHVHINRSGGAVPANLSFPSFPDLRTAESTIVGLLSSPRT